MQILLHRFKMISWTVSVIQRWPAKWAPTSKTINARGWPYCACNELRQNKRKLWRSAMVQAVSGTNLSIFDLESANNVKMFHFQMSRKSIEWSSCTKTWAFRTRTVCTRKNLTIWSRHTFSRHLAAFHIRFSSKSWTKFTVAIVKCIFKGQEW